MLSSGGIALKSLLGLHSDDTLVFYDRVHGRYVLHTKMSGWDTGYEPFRDANKYDSIKYNLK